MYNANHELCSIHWYYSYESELLEHFSTISFNYLVIVFLKQSVHIGIGIGIENKNIVHVVRYQRIFSRSDVFL